MQLILKKIELFLNIVHYCIYRLEKKRYLLFNKLNPFMLLGKIPAVKRKFEDEGTSHEEVVNKIWTNQRYGFGIMLSGGGLVIIIFLMIFSVNEIMNGLLNYPIKLSWRQLFVSCSVLSYIICHITVFQKDKYISYFKQFDKKSKQEKWKYGLVSLAFVVGTVSLWIYSFRFIPVL
ncbi:hypothetical protein [Cyclobacterium xiamenense]|uniref:hypothetical protein n=1 Tax=Cyclobacterium xiamenense TaxID=1297121 RepID=UPI0035D0D11F